MVLTNARSPSKTRQSLPHEIVATRALQLFLPLPVQGIILNTAALARQQECVAAAAAKGLTVMSYGRPNNHAGWVRQQLALGVQVGV